MLRLWLDSVFMHGGGQMRSVCYMEMRFLRCQVILGVAHFDRKICTMYETSDNSWTSKMTAFISRFDFHTFEDLLRECIAPCIAVCARENSEGLIRPEAAEPDAAKTI